MTMTKQMKINKWTSEIRYLKQGERAIHVGDELLIPFLPLAYKKDVIEVSKLWQNERTA